jgi:hypothetical protein
MMSGARMVHLRTVHNTFHARVIAARLGADGIVTQLRGSVDGPYPIGDVSLWVDEDDIVCAQELLLADEVESAFDVPEGAESARRRPFMLGLRLNQVMALIGIVVVVLGGVVARVLS